MACLDCDDGMSLPHGGGGGEWCGNFCVCVPSNSLSVALECELGSLLQLDYSNLSVCLV